MSQKNPIIQHLSIRGSCLTSIHSARSKRKSELICIEMCTQMQIKSSPMSVQSNFQIHIESAIKMLL